MIPDLHNDVFTRQFILGPRFPDFAGWDHTRIFDSYCLASHPRLAKSTAARADRELVCLGDIYDPDHPVDDNRQVLERLAQDGADFSALERGLQRVGGRWIVFARIGTQVRVYPDPTGSRPLFYCEADGAWLGSTPQIIAESLQLEKDAGIIAELNAYPRRDWWPGDVTPYRRILHMMPNHFFDMSRHEPRRFWPVEDLPTVTMEAAVPEILQLIQQITSAMANRYTLYAGITGGYDSRALLAGVRGLADKIEFFTVDYPGIKDRDLEIPRQIADRLHLDYRVVPFIEPSAEFFERFDRNAAGMVAGQCRSNAMTYTRFSADAMFLEGSASPVGKAVYYKKRPHPHVVTVDMLCEYSGFARNPVAAGAFERWLVDVPTNTNVRVLDLFYWEHRMGSWNAMDFTAQEITRQVMSPFNCRRILQSMLSVGAEDRQFPHRLHRALCDAGLPELRTVGFNTTRNERVKIFMKKVRRRFFGPGNGGNKA